MEDELEKRKQKIKKYLKENIIFIGIISFAIIVRFYYFLITKTQPLWWDEADYMAYAKTIAGVGSTSWIATPQHNSLFSYIAAIFLKLNFSEPAIKFILVTFPSILLVFLTYKICRLLYEDKRIALISSFIIATFWNILFNSFRFHLECLALLFAFLGIYSFFQGNEKKQKIFGKINPKYSTILVGIFIMVAYSIRRVYILFGVFIFFYFIITGETKNIIKNKFNWIAGVTVVVLFYFVDEFIFVSSLGDVAGTYYHAGENFSLDSIRIFSVYFDSLTNPIFFSFFKYLFWIGFFILCFNVILGFDYLRKKSPKQVIKSDFFNILSIIITLMFFIFVLRINVSEGRGYDARWFLPLLLASLVSISKGVLFLTDSIKKYSKQLSLIFMIILIGYGAIYELQHADEIIKIKIDSYRGIKDTGMYLNEISKLEDIIVTVPTTQTAYYAEREVLNPNILSKGNLSSEKNFNIFLDYLMANRNLKYILVSFIEPNHPAWMKNVEY
ncbi:MAG: glycosyltransferase family 39 protein, partial [Candidatus Pacearchaeota archaeon]|nr:glycosyltransferase family 39 protein [Candidatus Pacearchaeota archaeon]